MKHEEFNPVLFEEAYDALLERFNEYEEGCPKRRSAASDAQKKANQAGEAPKKQQARKKPEVAKKPDAKPKRKKSCRTPLPTYSEAQDFAVGTGTGIACGASHISASYVCRLDAGDRDKLTKELVAKGVSKSKLSKLSYQQISEVAKKAKAMSPKSSLSADEEKQVQAALTELKSYSADYQKKGGDNLQDPKAAAEYAKFYAADKDLTYKAPKETRPEVVKETLRRLKEEDPTQYKAVMKALNSKGSPEAGMKAEAGWKGKERGEAVLKSLMDNDFKDVLGQRLSWGQEMQLDHRTAGSVGGKDQPSNWIWISLASNQTKGGYESAAKKVKGTPQEKEAFIKRSLIEGLTANSKMSAAQVKEVKAKGAAAVIAKAEGASKTRKLLPTMTPSQRGQLIERSTSNQMKEILKASVAEGKNPVTGRPTSYRPVLSGGNGARVRKDYGTVPQMKALARMRWGEKLSSSDLSNIGGILKASTGSKKSPMERLDELLGNFPPSTGLTAAERIAIVDSIK